MKVALFGYGHLGKYHFQCLKESDFELIGVFDPRLDQSVIEDISVYNEVDQLIDNSDACVVASSTASHFQLAKDIISSGKHLFIEKPMTSTLEEALELDKLLDDQPHLISQVGFVERHNPAFKYVKELITDPKFIEVHRLASFQQRGSDVSVVYDLMIHDLDLILNLKQIPIKEIKAHGVKLISDSLDICNARIEFEDRSVANITASRMSMKKMRKFRIFQEDGYISMDLDNKESQFIQLNDQDSGSGLFIETGNKKKYLSIKSSGLLEGNAILSELNEFYNSINEGQQSSANVKSALKTTLLADQIEKIATESTCL